VALDTCYTRSMFRIIFMIVIGIDANNNVSLLSYVLVTVESEE
jgi:hypothetical protein